MPLYMNGTLVPENVANALYFNGTNITDVYMNGVQVWNQSLINITGWSGSSLGSTAYGNYGLQMSGLSVRTWINSTSYGSYIAVSSLGVWGTQSSTTSGFDLNTSGSQLRINSGAWVTFTPSTEVFTGSSSALVTSVNSTQYLETSGGLLRWKATGLFVDTGAWVSLT